MRRLTLFALFAVLVAGLLPGRAVAADPVCSVHVPAAVVLTAPYTAVWPTFDGCDSYPHVSWWFVAAQDPPMTERGRIDIENGVSQGPWRYRDSYPTGKYYVENINDAISPDDPPQNSTTTVVKYGSRISLTGHRETHLLVPLSG